MVDQPNEPALHTWEAVGTQDAKNVTSRMRVPGGWLYRHTDGVSLSCMAFVPEPMSAGAPAANVQAPGADVPANHAAFSGRWVGFWDGNPLWTTSLTIESVGPAGDVTGSYAYMSGNPARFAATIADDTITFGSRYKFAFRLRPDGKIEGTRNDAGLLNTTVLIRG
jgi:hypothetical protein